jgi:hypothetical protein
VNRPASSTGAVGGRGQVVAGVCSMAQTSVQSTPEFHSETSAFVALFVTASTSTFYSLPASVVWQKICVEQIHERPRPRCVRRRQDHRTCRCRRNAPIRTGRVNISLIRLMMVLLWVAVTFARLEIYVRRVCQHRRFDKRQSNE